MHLEEIARSYVTLTHKIHLHSNKLHGKKNDYIDVYFGPDDLIIPEGTSPEEHPLDQLAVEAQTLLDHLHKLENSDDNPTRIAFLQSQLSSAKAYIGVLNGEKNSLDDETKAVYAVLPMEKDEAFIQNTLVELETVIGKFNTEFGLTFEGDLREQITQIYKIFELPKNQIMDLANHAVGIARKKTLEFITLPEHEELLLERVHGKSWTGYNWYLGNAKGRVEINHTAEISIAWIVRLALHEAYTGHHTLWLLQEQELYEKNGWVEFSVYPLYSPMSIVAEGLAKYTEEFVFEKREKAELMVDLVKQSDVYTNLVERGIADDQLTDLMELYIELLDAHAKLDFLAVEAVRKYYDGMDGESLVTWIMDKGKVTEERARQRKEFGEDYRSYVATYGAGLELIEKYMEKAMHEQIGGRDLPAEEIKAIQWDIYHNLLISPQMPQLIQEYLDN